MSTKKSVTKNTPSRKLTTRIAADSVTHVVDELPPQRAVKQATLSLTAYELLHLRDLFGVLVPPVGDHTISQSLAALENRVLVEGRLWSKVKAACVEVGVSVESEAPDYVIAPIAAPPMGVFRLADSPSGPEAPEGAEEKSGDEDGGVLFSGKEND